MSAVWAERARAHFSEKRQNATDKTAETHVLSVSSVGVVALFENCALAAELLDAAMKACDHWRDGPEAREQMKKEVMETPPHLRGDLLEHFKQVYGGAADAAD